jgi:uncharacterized SAM-binding protein YcdF (DUF218 family)
MKLLITLLLPSGLAVLLFLTGVVDHAVVLTGWAAADDDMPLTGRMNASAAYRVLMALELARERPDLRFVVSGEHHSALVMAEALRKLGIADDHLIVDDSSSSTAQSMASMARRVPARRIFLVTSAGHLPRALAAADRHGIESIPVPTDYQMPRDWKQADWMPTPGSLYVSDLAIREYLGRAWYQLTQ